MRPTDPTRRFLPRLAAAWCRADLPAKSTVARRLARVDDDRFWAGSGQTDTRDRWNRHTLRLDPREYFQRWAWLLGRYHEWPLQLLLTRALAPGDTFVDVGANYGLVSLHAAHLVGPGGRVVAFEPNPDVLERLHWHVRANALTPAPSADARPPAAAISVVPIALGRNPGTATLRLASPNTGAASLAPLPWAADAPTTHQCVVDCGDDRLGDLPERPTFIKVDVEGFECEVLAGLKQTIARLHPAIVCEVNRRCLRAAGAGLNKMLRITRRDGYQPFLFEARRSPLGRNRLGLTPFTSPPPGLFDLLFLHPDSIYAARLGVPGVAAAGLTPPTPPAASNDRSRPRPEPIPAGA